MSAQGLPSRLLPEGWMPVGVPRQATHDGLQKIR